MISLDTNIILRFLIGDVPEQTSRAQNVINVSACYVTDVVVTETIFVLERVFALSRNDIALTMKRFLALQNIIYSSQVIDDAIDLFAAHGKLSIVDCYSAVEAAMSNASLITFDKDLIKFGGKHIGEPGQSGTQ